MAHRFLAYLCALIGIAAMFGSVAASMDAAKTESAASRERISLKQIAIVTDSTEPSYIQYGIQDLAIY
jgi:hypothetical protein